MIENVFIVHCNLFSIVTVQRNLVLLLYKRRPIAMWMIIQSNSKQAVLSVSYRCSLLWILQNLQDKTSLKGAAEVKPAVLHVFMLCTVGSAEALIHPTALQQNKHLHQYHCTYCSWEWCLCEASSVNSVANGNSNTAGKS